MVFELGTMSPIRWLVDMDVLLGPAWPVAGDASMSPCAEYCHAREAVCPPVGASSGRFCTISQLQKVHCSVTTSSVSNLGDDAATRTAKVLSLPTRAAILACGHV